MSKQELVRESLAVLAEMFDRQISPATVRAYTGLLSGYSEGQIRAGFNAVARKCKFWPKPADIIELIEGRDSDSQGQVEAAANQSWAVIMRSLNRYAGLNLSDHVALEAVRQIGGLSALCDCDGESERFLRRDYIAAYKRIVSSGMAVSGEPLAGDHNDGTQLRLIDTGTNAGRVLIGSEPLKLGAGNG